MLLEEDSYLELPDRARQITDVILDLEEQLKAEYRAILDKKDELIEKLNQHISRADPRVAGTRRGRSEPAFLS
jgi:hypothetical protein